MKITNKKGITLIVLIVTIIILMLLASVSLLVITNGNIITEARRVKREEKVSDYKNVVKSSTNKIIGLNEYSSVTTLANDIQSDLRSMKGLEEVTITSEGDDYLIEMPEEISFTFEEATGKKLSMYIDNYVTINELEGR